MMTPLPESIGVDDAVKCRSCHGTGLETSTERGVNFTDFCVCAVGRRRLLAERAAETAFWEAEAAAQRWADEQMGLAA